MPLSFDIVVGFLMFLSGVVMLARRGTNEKHITQELETGRLKPEEVGRKRRQRIVLGAGMMLAGIGFLVGPFLSAR